jgi:hypothetical protein
MRLLPSCVRLMLGKSAPPTTSRLSAAISAVEPEQLLFVLSQAMNSLVVEVVKADNSSSRSGDERLVPLHMSDAALRGFVHLHHL